MKKSFSLVLLLAVMSLVVPGCSSKHYVGMYFIDYSHLHEDGIFVTESWSVPFEYIPVGSISVIEYAGKDNKKSNGHKKKKLFTGEFYDDEVKADPNWFTPTPSSALDSLAVIVKEMGADGIIGLRIRSIQEKPTSRKIDYEVSGMVIKRK